MLHASHGNIGTSAEPLCNSTQVGKKGPWRRPNEALETGRLRSTEYDYDAGSGTLVFHIIVSGGEDT